MRPAFTGSGYDDDINDTRLNSRQHIASPYHGAILLDGILYAAGPCPDLKPDHRYHSITTYQVPAARTNSPATPATANSAFAPTTVWTLTEAPSLHIQGQLRRIQCQPPLEVCASLQQQRERQEQEALDVIRQHSGVADLDPRSKPATTPAGYRNASARATPGARQLDSLRGTGHCRPRLQLARRRCIFHRTRPLPQSGAEAGAGGLSKGST